MGYKIKNTREYNKFCEKNIRIDTLNGRVVGVGEKFTVELVNNLVFHKADENTPNRDYLRQVHLIAVPKDAKNTRMTPQQLKNLLKVEIIVKNKSKRIQQRKKRKNNGLRMYRKVTIKRERAKSESKSDSESESEGESDRNSESDNDTDKESDYKDKTKVDQDENDDDEMDDSDEEEEEEEEEDSDIDGHKISDLKHHTTTMVATKENGANSINLENISSINHTIFSIDSNNSNSFLSTGNTNSSLSMKTLSSTTTPVASDSTYSYEKQQSNIGATRVLFSNLSNNNGNGNGIGINIGGFACPCDESTVDSINSTRSRNSSSIAMTNTTGLVGTGDSLGEGAYASTTGDGGDYINYSAYNDYSIMKRFGNCNQLDDLQSIISKNESSIDQIDDFISPATLWDDFACGQPETNSSLGYDLGDDGSVASTAQYNSFVFPTVFANKTSSNMIITNRSASVGSGIRMNINGSIRYYAGSPSQQTPERLQLSPIPQLSQISEHQQDQIVQPQQATQVTDNYGNICNNGDFGQPNQK